MKHVHIKGYKQIEWECDYCHLRFPHARKPPVKCEVCGKDLCKSCKRHIHLETGTGNGSPIREQVNLTKNYCPDYFAVAVQPILKLLEVEGG